MPGLELCTGQEEHEEAAKIGVATILVYVALQVWSCTVIHQTRLQYPRYPNPQMLEIRAASHALGRKSQKVGSQRPKWAMILA